jgi:7-keto-8-aminopelargonate synthetase-like enzyme
MSTAENITFMVIRGAIALAIVGLGFYCVAQGIHFFALPRVEAEQIRIHLIGLDITAGELGALIFAAGLAVCYVGQRTARMRIETTRGTPLWTQTRPAIPALPELTAVLDALQRNATRFEPAKAKEGIGMSVAEGHMAIPTAARQLPSAHRTSESITFVEGTRKPPTRTD